MNKFNLSKIAKDVQIAVKKHSPEILTGIGIAGMITTTVMAVRSTPKAIELIDYEKRNRSEEYYDKDKAEWCGSPFTAKDIIIITWKCYVPAAITGAMSVACLIGASSVNVRRNAALATAYTLSESALKGYQEKVIETIGEKKERDVRDAVAKEHITRNPVSSREVIITERGNTLCYDVISGRYFKSDIDKLKKAVNELNRQMRNDMCISLNEFYDEIGLNHIAVGDDLGWDIGKGYIELDFSSQLTDDETPCLVIGHSNLPTYDYR